MKHVALLLGIAAQMSAFTSCTTTADNDSPVTAGAVPADSSAPSFKATAEADRAAKKTEATITPYPFETCAVQFHKPFKDGIPKHRRVYQGQEVLFCCTPCVKAFDMNPDPYMPRIVAAAKAQQTGSSQ
ncbi:MAG: hypothetical protein P1U68_00310 [Verrucomicrobiales bacterium]|nr:hypothetical protein [Verrucomicrobiales bacterium]